MFTHDIYRNIRVRVIIVRGAAMLFHAPGTDATTRGPYRCLPGGGLEPNETLCDAGEREVFEETGLRVKVKSVAFLREWVIPKNISLADARAATQSLWGSDQPGAGLPHHAYGLEVFLWADISDGFDETLRPSDGHGAIAEWVSLERIEDEPLFPCELRALARDLMEGRAVPGIPSFATGLGTPLDKPDYDAFRRVESHRHR